ncbi:hypothetical protein GTA08_BOTSDO11788 [Neofusicoccum parvum]|nr:hypothetical protein GTA08_BOTSDO11788 [Neofusicoccum parvum]
MHVARSHQSSYAPLNMAVDVYDRIPYTVQRQFDDEEINYWQPAGSEYYYAKICVTCQITRVIARTGTYSGTPECDTCEPPVMQARAGQATYIPTEEDGICASVDFSASVCTPVWKPTTLTKETVKTLKVPTPVPHYQTTKETQYITKSYPVTQSLLIPTPVYKTKTESKVVTIPIYKTKIESKVITTPIYKTRTESTVITTPVYKTKETTKIVPTTEKITQTLPCPTCPGGSTTTVKIHKTQTTATTQYVTCQNKTETVMTTMKSKETKTKTVPTTVKKKETEVKTVPTTVKTKETETRSVPYTQLVTSTEKCNTCAGGYTTTVKTKETEVKVVPTTVVTKGTEVKTVPTTLKTKETETKSVPYTQHDSQYSYN